VIVRLGALARQCGKDADPPFREGCGPADELIASSAAHHVLADA
jgi:hypothetical protein